MSEQEQPEMLPDAAVKRIRWLVDPNRGLLLPLSCIYILALDWIPFSSNVISAGIATPIVIGIGFLLGGGGVLLFQEWIAGDGCLKAIAKAFASGIAVVVPWPAGRDVVRGDGYYWPRE